MFHTNLPSFRRMFFRLLDITHSMHYSYNQSDSPTDSYNRDYNLYIRSRHHPQEYQIPRNTGTNIPIWASTMPSIKTFKNIKIINYKI
jgi:hypothetical protein